MRPARLPAACALLVLTIGPVALATAPALAADATPTPSSSATGDCPEGTTADPIPVTSSSDVAGELAVTFTNPGTATAKQLATTVALADGGSLPVELRAGSGAWKSLTVTGSPLNTGSYQLPQGQRLTLRVRLAAGAAQGDHRLTFTARSEVLPSGSAPAKKYTCPQLTASYTAPLTPANRTPDPTHLGAGTATRPLAIAGTTALLLGTALLVLTRRRPATD